MDFIGSCNGRWQRNEVAESKDGKVGFDTKTHHRVGSPRCTRYEVRNAGVRLHALLSIRPPYHFNPLPSLSASILVRFLYFSHAFLVALYLQPRRCPVVASHLIVHSHLSLTSTHCPSSHGFPLLFIFLFRTVLCCDPWCFRRRIVLRKVRLFPLKKKGLC